MDSDKDSLYAKYDIVKDLAARSDISEKTKIACQEYIRKGPIFTPASTQIATENR